MMLILEAGWSVRQGQWSNLQCPGTDFHSPEKLSSLFLYWTPLSFSVKTSAVPLSYNEEGRGRMHAIRLLCTCVQSGNTTPFHCSPPIENTLWWQVRGPLYLFGVGLPEFSVTLCKGKKSVKVCGSMCAFYETFCFHRQLCTTVLRYLGF